MTRAVWQGRTLAYSPVHYCLCLTEKQFHKELKALGVPKKDYPEFLKSPFADATAHHLESSEGRICTLVCLGDVTNRTLAEVCGLLVHEATHIWQNVRHYLGESNPSVEFEAYSMQNISQNLIETYLEISTKK